jgi:aminomethyltransferase
MTARKTPFYDVGMSAGAEMRELFGYYLPWHYANGGEAEHLMTREHTSVCDLDYMAEYGIVGPQALDFVQALLTNDFRNLRIGQVRYTAMCQSEGKMVDDGTLWRLGENEYVLITGSEDDYKWVTENAARFDVEVTNRTASWTTLAVQGPESRSVVGALVGSEVVDSLRYYTFTRTSAAGSECILARMGYTGELGFEFHLEPDGGEALWRALMEAGRKSGILPCGQQALESLRQEAGYLLVGNDHDPTTNPFEAGIGRVVRFGKPEFNGRSALASVRRDGVNRQMVWMRLADKSVVSNGDAILVDGAEIGRVTSGSYSPTQARGVAMGYVKTNYVIPGLGVDIRSGSAVRQASVSVMPLYDPGDVLTRQR